MKTSCVLTEADVKNLYIVAGTVINEAMKNGEVFEPKALMQRVFDLYDKKNDPITGALFVQQLPSIINIIVSKPSMRGVKIDKTLDLLDLRDKFLDPDTGIDNVFEIFNPKTDPETLKTLVAIQKGIELNDQNEKKPVQRADVRLGAYSPFGLTMQMFEAKNPSEKGEFEIEKLDKSKDRIYNTLFNIKKALPEDFNGMSEAVYEGVTLVLTPRRLPEMNKDWLDKYTSQRIGKSFRIRKSPNAPKNVTEATEMIVMVLTDKATNQFVKFDEDGHIDNNGKPVYQHLRDTRIENGRFRVTDIYGLSDQIITPRQLLDNQIADSELSTEEFEAVLAKQGRTIDQVLKEIDADQQEQFKILYGMKQDILSGKLGQYSITGISNGLNFGYVRKTIPFNELTDIPGVSNDVYKTLSIIKSPRDGFGQSQAVVTINDREFAVNRPNMDENIIDKIVAVLTNPNISDSNKYSYVSQFTVNLDSEVQRHKINYDQGTQKISFFYAPYTYQKSLELKAKAQKKAQENNETVDLAQLNKLFAHVKLVLSAPDAKTKIKEVLTNAYYNNGKYQTSKMKYDTRLLKKSMDDYNMATGKFVKSNYIDFIKEFPADVVFTPENSLGVFNSYIMFRPNTAFTESLNKAKEKVDNGVPTLLTFVKPTIDLSRLWRGDLESRPVYTPEGVNTMRSSASNAFENFGNPFSEAGYGSTIKVPSIGAAVIAYKEWLLGTNYQDVKPEQRTWILDQINQGKLDGATLLYAGKSAARGQGMHPTALAEVVEQLRSKPTQLSTSVEPNVILPIGTSGSGKSTFIKSLPQKNLVVISPDEMRVEFTGDINDKSKDKEIYIEAAKRAIQAVKNGKQVVFDTTNLTKDKRVPFIEAIKKAIPTANIQYKLMELNPELAKQRIKAQLERGENRANVSDETIDRHAESYKQMLEDIKSEDITNYDTTQPSTDVKEGVQELFESNPELANAVYEAMGFKQTLTQDNKSYYRGQYAKPEIDDEGNLYLTSREDSLYAKAGLESYGVSMTEKLENADEYGSAKNEIESNTLEEQSGYDINTWEYDAKQAEIYENGYWVIQIDKDVSNKVIREAGEVKLLGKVKIPKGKWRIENRNSNGDVEVNNQITPQQKQQALQLYSQYLDTIFPNSKVKDIVYHGTDKEFDSFKTFVESNVEGIFYTYNKESVKIFGKVIPVLANSTKPLIEEDSTLYDSISKEAKENLTKNYDSVITPNEMGVVFESKQVHILGNKQDIEGFKNFINKVSPVIETKVQESNIGESSINFPTVPTIEEGIQPKDTKGPETENTEVGKLFNRFQWDRSAKLPNGVTKEQIQAAQEWWSKSPLSKIISLTQIGNIVNSDSFANFIINGATLADTSININTGIGGTMVDVYHEAWHGFSQLFLTKEEKTKLYNEVKNFKDAKGNQPNIDKSFFELEEMLAEDFRSYILNPKATKGAPTRNSLFRRILNFIKGLFNKNFKREEVAGEVTLVPAVKELYDNLYMASGDPSLLNKYKPNVDNAMFSMLDRGISSVEDKKAEVLNFQDSTELVNSIDSIISDVIDSTYADSVALAKQQNNDKIVSKAGAVKILTDTRNKKVAYTMVQEELQKRYNAVLTELEAARTENDAVKVDQLEDVARILKLGLENFGDETKGLVKYHIENSTFDIVRQKFVEIDYADDEENKTVAEEAQTSERYGDKVVNDKSLQELASKETLYILKSLFKKSGKNYVYNKLGFKELADFTTTWNNVTRAIGGIKDRVEMYDALKTAAITFPELQQLLDYKLPDPTKALDRFEFSISSAFWQDFKKPRVTYIQLTAFKEGKGYELEVTEASIEVSSVLRKFQNKFKADTDNRYVNRVNNINTLDLQKVAEKFARKDNGAFDSTKAFEFASAIGLYMDELSIIKNELSANKQYYSLEYTFNAIKELAELERQSDTPKNKVTSKQLRVLGDFKLDPIGVLRAGIPAGIISDKEFKQKNIIERFAELQGKYGADSSNFSVLNAERNLVSEHIEDNTVSMIVHAINKAKKLQDLWGTDELQYMSYLNPEINSFTLRSKILNSIFAIDTNSFEKRAGKSLELNYVSGTQIAEGSEGANTTSLDVYSKFLQEMHMMLKGGLQEFMRHASKSSSFGVRVGGDIIGGMGKGDDGHLYIDLDMFAPNGNADQYAVDEFFIDYMDAELERIQKFNNNVDTFKNYAGYNRVLEYDSNGDPKLYAGQVFTAFDNVLTDETKEFIYKNIKTGTIKDYIETNPDFKEILSNEVKNYFEGQTIKNEGYLNEVDYVDPKLLKILTAIGMSKTDAKTALVKAFTYNSWIHNFETASLMYGDVVQYNHAKEEMHKRNTGSTSGGRGFLTDVYARKFINGFIKNTSYASVLSQLPQFGNSVLNWDYDGTFNTAILRDINRKSVYLDQIRKGLTTDYTRRLSNGFKGEALTNEVKRRVDIEMETYEKMEEADGQGYITFDAYRSLRYLENNWSDKQEALFQKIAQGKDVDMSDITEFFPVYKLQNFGHLANTELPVNAMHKFALMPLIPSVIKGSDFESLHHQMLKSGIQYATFQTGSKVGSVTKDGKPDQIYNDEVEQKNLKSDIEFTPNVVYLEYLKNVTAVPTKYKGKTVFSTQLRKLILEGLYEQGIINNPNVAGAAKAYEQAVDDYTDILKTQLLEEIGYEYKNGKYIGNLGDFLKVVRNELGRRALPEHHIKFVNVNEDNTVKTDLSLHLEADEIEKILVSLIEKRLVKQKVKGEALVQVSSGISNRLWNQGSKFTGATDEDIRKYMGSNNLPFYNNINGKTAAMKVAIALQGDFVNLLKLNHLDGQPIATRARLNEMIKEDEWLDMGSHPIYKTAFSELKSTKGDSKLFILESDLTDEMKKDLIPDTKNGQRVKGKEYYGIKILGDFYSHKTAKSSDGDALDIIVVKSKEDAQKQYDAYIKGGAKQFIGLSNVNVTDNRKSVTLTAVRIPVQGLNSMEFMEVYEFLDPAAGNIIIPPSEIVAKSGADFDVDKLTTFMPSINENGDFRINDDKFTNQSLKTLIDKIKKSDDPKKRDQILRLIEERKKVLENNLITSIRSILELPENYANLVRPNGTYLLKDIADDLESDVVDYNKFENEHKEGDRFITDKKGKAKKVISPSRIFEVGYNLHKHDVNMVGKAGLGIVAIENSLSPVFNALGAKMPLTYKPVYFDEGRQRYVEDVYGKDMEMRLRLNHNTTPKGNISLSNVLNAEGDAISDLYSQMMNGLVDVEKDAWIFFIQGNTQIIPVLTYLIKAGVPKNEAINFVSQPLVREYVKQQKILGSVYGKLSGQAPKAESYVKYEASNLAINKLVNPEISQPIYEGLNVVNIKNTTNSLVDTQKYQLRYLGKRNGEIVELSKTMTGAEIREGVDNALDKGNRGINHIKAIRQYNAEQEKYINLYTPASSLVTNNNYYTAASLATTGSFDTEDMRNRLAGGFPIDLKSLDMFLHFIEIEKQIKGIQALKRESNPDTKTSKTIQEIVERTVALEDLSDLSKIDPELVDKLRNESILNSFFDNQIVLDLLEPLFKLRNNKKINEYVSYAISAYASSITRKYGKGQDGVRQFINEYKNSVVNYIFQNYMTNTVNAQGQVVNVPEIYRGSQVVNTKAELTNGILFQSNTFYVNEEVLRNQFTNKTYLDSSASTDSYKNVGLTPFRDQDDPFDTFSSYLRYVMEREFIKNKFPEVSMTPKTGWLKSRDYGTFLNQRALINSFNQKAIVGTEGYSFTKLVQSVIQEYPHLKDKYPVLLQLSEANLRGPEKILTLSNKALAKGDLAESYNLNLEDLANPNVQKAIDKDDVETNNYISEVFKILPIMSIYQNGVGYSKYGINKVLPYDQFLLVIENASINFINRNLNLNTFDTIFESLFKGKEYFKNYVQTPLEFNSISNTNKLAKEEILSVPILEIDLQKAAIKEETPVNTVIEFDTTTDDVEAAGMVRNRLSDVLGEEPKEEFLMQLYQNYKNLMGRNKEREDSVTPYKNFVGYITNSNVIKYKDTYIFGTYEPRMNVFVSNMNSSPTSKQLLAEAIPYISKQFDVIGFAPKDVTDKYKRSGYEVSNNSFNYNFKGEKMDKYMYASNPGISMRLFGKPIEEVSSEEIKKISERGLAIDAYKKVWKELTKFEENADINIVRDALNDLKVPPHITYNVIRDLDSWLNQSRESLNETIKAMEARGEVYNKRNPPRRKLIKKYLVKNLSKLYDFSKVDIDPIDTNALNRIVPETENELNKLLVNYLASFGIKFEYTDIKEKLGMDSLAVADILNKIAYVQKDNSEDLPNIAGKFIAFMLQHNPLVTETYEALRKQSRYKSASKDEILNVIGELISEQLHKRTNTDMPKSLIDKIKLIIDYLFNVINKVRVQKINKNIGVIVDGVISRNKSLITAGKYKPGAEGKPVVPVSLQEALDSDPFATAVVDKMAEHFMLGGSTTASEQGTIYRPDENQVHDLDWVSFLTRAKGKEVFESMFPNNIYVREILDEEGGLSTDTWLIAPEGYTIENVKFQGSRRKVIDYDIVDSKGKVVSKYIANTDSHTGKIGAKAIDIFSYDEVTPEKTKYKEMQLKSGITLRISDWRNTFAAKLGYGRLKDIWDYNRYIPNEYVESITPDISDKFVDMGEYQNVVGEDGTTADRKMRQLADGALVESIESFSPAQTTLRVVQKKIKDLLSDELKSGVITQTKGRARLVAPLDNIQNPVIMLSRNYSLKDRPLDAPVRQALDVYMSKNAKFIFGNSSTERPFLEYLLSKKYDNFTVYALTPKGKDKSITVDELFPETVEEEETTTFEKSDSDILNTVEFSNFFNSEILKNPELNVEEILEYYKKCKLGQ